MACVLKSPITVQYKLPPSPQKNSISNFLLSVLWYCRYEQLLFLATRPVALLLGVQQQADENRNLIYLLDTIVLVVLLVLLLLQSSSCLLQLVVKRNQTYGRRITALLLCELS